jgi:hypothetical protein
VQRPSKKLSKIGSQDLNSSTTYKKVAKEGNGGKKIIRKSSNELPPLTKNIQNLNGKLQIRKNLKIGDSDTKLKKEKKEFNVFKRSMSDMELKTREKPISKSKKNSSIDMFQPLPKLNLPGSKNPTQQGKLITNKLEENRTKEQSEPIRLNFDNRPNSVATAATKHHKAHS